MRPALAHTGVRLDVARQWDARDPLAERRIAGIPGVEDWASARSATTIRGRLRGAIGGCEPLLLCLQSQRRDSCDNLRVACSLLFEQLHVWLSQLSVSLNLERELKCPVTSVSSRKPPSGVSALLSLAVACGATAHGVVQDTKDNTAKAKAGIETLDVKTAIIADKTVDAGAIESTPTPTPRPSSSAARCRTQAQKDRAGQIRASMRPATRSTTSWRWSRETRARSRPSQARESAGG